MSPNADLDKICTVLDKLTLDKLTVLEEVIQAKLELEKSMCDGEMHLAKTRYIMGRNSVSVLQLPTENSTEFDASTVVHSEEDEKLFGEKTLDLEVRKPIEGKIRILYGGLVSWFHRICI